MEETYCIADKRKTPVLNQVVIKEIKVDDYNFIINVLSVDVKKLYVKENGQVGKGKKNGRGKKK